MLPCCSTGSLLLEVEQSFSLHKLYSDSFEKQNNQSQTQTACSTSAHDANQPNRACSCLKHIPSPSVPAPWIGLHSLPVISLEPDICKLGVGVAANTEPSRQQPPRWRLLQGWSPPAALLRPAGLASAASAPTS